MSVNLDLFYFINHNMQNPIFDLIMPVITEFGGFVGLCVILIILIVYASFKKYKTFRKVLILTLIALLFSDLIVLLLKNLIQEPRPFVTLSDVHLLINEADPNSFPSGHACSTLTVIVVLISKMKILTEKHYKLISALLIVFAITIGFSRIYIGVHYPFDVLAGSVVGIAGALIFIKLNEALNFIKI